MSPCENAFKRPDINKLKLGEIVRIPPSFQSGMPSLEGTVVYIHPKLRFFTLEFTCGGNRIRESFCAYGQIN